MNDQQLGVLAQELQAPVYAALVAAGDHVAIAAMLNAPQRSAPSVAVDVPCGAVARALSAQDLLQLTPEVRDVLRTLLLTPGDLTPGQMAELAGLLPADSGSFDRVTKLATRQPTRAELLGLPAPVDYALVGVALAPTTVARQAPPDPTPSRVFARFIAQGGELYLPALAPGSVIDEGTTVAFMPDGFRSPSFPPELLPGVHYVVLGVKAAAYLTIGADPKGPPLVVSDGGGLIEFPGLTLRQVRI